MDIYHLVQRNSLGFLYVCPALSGVSGNNVRDKFVLENRISCNNTTITVLTPLN